MTQLNPAAASAFEAAYKKALPDELEEVKNRTAERFAAMAEMGMPMPLLDSVVSLGSFCTQWPKVKIFLNMAIRTVGWFMPGPAAMAKAFMAAFETAVMPIVCPKPPAE